MERNIRKMTPYDLVGVPKLGKLEGGARPCRRSCCLAKREKKVRAPGWKKECGGLYVHTHPS
jgi:hypothetical protein